MTLIAYTDQYQDWQLGAEHPTNPVRARLAVEKIIDRVPSATVWTEWAETDEAFPWVQELTSIHDTTYITDVLMGYSDEWMNKNRLLGRTALTMFGGTVSLVEAWLRGEGEDVMFNPQGAKHHAHYNQSSGFCVFNDMAWAAKTLADAGRRVAYVDWDAHHGDGVEFLLEDRLDIPTYSIHDGAIFPGTGKVSRDGAYNWSLEIGAGDAELLAAMDEICSDLKENGTDFILLACGADGLLNDPLSTLEYSLEGLDEAARKLKSVAVELNAPVLIGGAGGYQPHTETPEHWARVVAILS